MSWEVCFLQQFGSRESLFVMKITVVKKSQVLLLCLQMTAGARAPAWKGNFPPHGRGSLKAVPYFPISVSSLFPTSFLLQSFPLPVTPLWSTVLLFLSRGGHCMLVLYVTSARRALCLGQAEAVNPCSCCRHTYQSDSSLVISHSKPEDAGIYTCLVSDGRTERRQIQLQIIGDLSSA